MTRLIVIVIVVMGSFRQSRKRTGLPEPEIIARVDVEERSSGANMAGDSKIYAVYIK